MMNYWPVLRSGGLLLASVALVPFPAGAQAPGATTTSVPAMTSVSRVEIGGDGERTTVRVEGGDTGEMSYRVSRLADPPRVVLDVNGARLSVGRNAIPRSFAPIRGASL